ncbi:MAG: glycosyltransferase family 2 protein [Oscillospiraceae bacterium]
MKVTDIRGVPDYEENIFTEKSKEYCVLIPIINESDRIIKELLRAQLACISSVADIILCDGGSTDGSMEKERLKSLNVSVLLTKLGNGKQGAQLRMGLYFALKRGYKGIITIDGNNKDSIESVPLFIDKLKSGYDLVQGSRFIKGGTAENTPISRFFAVRLIHAPIISLTAKAHFTDTTNAFRAYSKAYLEHSKVQPFRNIFMGYELLAYLSVRASQLGLKVCEVPVARIYPKNEAAPTKIKGVKGNADLMKILFKNALGNYNPK